MIWPCSNRRRPASVGVDPQPFYRRMYNPIRQQRTLDPDGVYVRRYVEELRDVPLDHLAEPWANGVDYPAPIVDLREAREAAFARFVQESR